MATWKRIKFAGEAAGSFSNLEVTGNAELDGQVTIGGDVFLTQAGNVALELDSTGGGSSRLKLNSKDANGEHGEFFFQTAGTTKAKIYHHKDGILYLQTGGTTTALTLDASQNATFAGRVSGTTAGGFYLKESTSNAFSIKSNGANGYLLFRDEYNSADRLKIEQSGQLSILGSMVVTGSSTFYNHVHVSSDTKKIYVGASNDFMIGHDGSHTYLENSTGELRIVQSSGDHFSIWTDPTGSGTDTKRFNIAPTGLATFYGTIADIPTTGNALLFLGETSTYGMSWNYNRDGNVLQLQGHDGHAIDAGQVYLSVTRDTGITTFTGYEYNFNAGVDGGSGNATFAGNILLGASAAITSGQVGTGNITFGTTRGINWERHGSTPASRSWQLTSDRTVSGELQLFVSDAADNTPDTEVLSFASDQSATFSGDVKLNGSTNPTLEIDAPSGQRPIINFDSGDATEAHIYFQQGSATKSYIQGGITGNEAITFFTGGTTQALKLDSSQNATFAGAIALADGQKIHGDSATLGYATFGSSTGAKIGYDGGNGATYFACYNGNVDIGAGGGSALAINSSKDATFAGSVTATNITSSGNLTYTSKLLGSKNIYTKEIANFDADEWFFAFNVTGGSLNSIVQFSTKGTGSNGHLQSHDIRLQVLHYRRFQVKSWGGRYSQLLLKLVSDGNENFDVYLKSSTSLSTCTLQLNIETQSPETYVGFSAGGYSGGTTTEHYHTTKAGTVMTSSNNTTYGQDGFETDGSATFTGAVGVTGTLTGTSATLTESFSYGNRPLILNNGTAETGSAYDMLVINSNDAPTIRLNETGSNQELTINVGDENTNSGQIGVTGKLVFSTNRSAGTVGYAQESNTIALTLDTSQNATFGGTIQNANGSAAAPAYAFTTQASTGMYKPGTNQLYFSVGGTRKMRVEASQIVLEDDTSVGGTFGVSGISTLGDDIALDGMLNIYQTSSGGDFHLEGIKIQRASVAGQYMRISQLGGGSHFVSVVEGGGAKGGFDFLGHNAETGTPTNYLNLAPTTGNAIFAGDITMTGTRGLKATNDLQLYADNTLMADFWLSGVDPHVHFKGVTRTSDKFDQTGTLTNTFGGGATFAGNVEVSKSSQPHLQIQQTSGNAWRWYTNGTDSFIRNATGGHNILSLSANGDVGFYDPNGASTPFFWDASTERLGIGNIAPEEKLHITDGKLKIDRSSGAGTGDVEIHFDRRHDAADARIIAKAGASGAYGTELHFVTTHASNGEATGLVIDDNQYVGIGTTSPSSALFISAPTSSAGLPSATNKGYFAATNDTTFGIVMGDVNYNVSPYTQYIQAMDGRQTVATTFPLALQPIGGNVGIGTDSPGNTLELSGASNAAGEIKIGTYSTGGHSGALIFQTSRNATIGSDDTIVTADQYLGYIEAKGADGNSFPTAARISFEVDASPADQDMPGRIVFHTTADGGVSLTEALRLDSSQNATFAGSVSAGHSSAKITADANYSYIDGNSGHIIRYNVGGTLDNRFLFISDTFYPTADNAYNLGKASYYWANVRTYALHAKGLVSVGAGSDASGNHPNGWNDTYQAKLQVASTSSGYDAAVQIHSSSADRGLDLWIDGNQAIAYIDSRRDNDAGNLVFRTKTAGTPIEALKLEGTGNATFGGNVNISTVALPSGMASSSYDQLRVSTGTVLADSGGTNSASMLMQNAYVGSGNNNYFGQTSWASRLMSTMGAFTFSNASGSADGQITWSDKLTIAQGGNATFAGNVEINGTGILTIDSSTSVNLYLDRSASTKHSSAVFQTAGSTNWAMGLTDSDVSGVDGSEFYIGQTANGTSNALKIDTSNNATFAGTVDANSLKINGSWAFEDVGSSTLRIGESFGTLQHYGDSTFAGDITAGGKGLIKYGSSSAWSANTGNAGANDFLQLHNDSTLAGYYTALRFSSGSGATESTGYFSYVRTADYQGKLVFTQRTAVSTYVDSLIIDSSSNATFAGTITTPSLRLGSSGDIRFNGSSTDPGSDGGYGINNNDGYFDTINSGADSDPLEILYYRGSHVRIGTGVNGSKDLKAGGLYQAGNKVVDVGGGQTIAGNATFGGDVSLNVDNKKLKIGASGDFEVYHDASSTRINSATGNLIINNSSGAGNTEFEIQGSGSYVFDASPATFGGTIGSGAITSSGTVSGVAGTFTGALTAGSGGAYPHHTIYGTCHFYPDADSGLEINNQGGNATGVVAKSGDGLYLGANGAAGAIGINLSQEVSFNQNATFGGKIQFDCDEIGTGDSKGLVMRSHNASQIWGIRIGRSGVNNVDFAIYDETDDATRMYIDGSGNTTFSGTVALSDDKAIKFGASTDGTLQYVSATNIFAASIGADAGIITQQAGSTNNYWSKILLGGRGASTTGFKVYTRSTERLSIADDTGNATFAGDVAIGRGTTPNGILHLNDSSGTAYFRMSSRVADDSEGWYFKTSGDASNTYLELGSRWGSDTARVNFTATGATFAGKVITDYIQENGDTGNYIHMKGGGNNNIEFYTGSTERLQISDDGVEVKGTNLAIETGQRFFLDSEGGGTWIEEDVNNEINFFTSAAKRVSVNSGGLDVDGDVDADNFKIGGTTLNGLVISEAVYDPTTVVTKVVGDANVMLDQFGDFTVPSNGKVMYEIQCFIDGYERKMCKLGVASNSGVSTIAVAARRALYCDESDQVLIRMLLQETGLTPGAGLSRWAFGITNSSLSSNYKWGYGGSVTTDFPPLVLRVMTTGF